VVWSENGVNLDVCDRLDRRQSIFYEKMDSFVVFYEGNGMFPGNTYIIKISVSEPDPCHDETCRGQDQILPITNALEAYSHSGHRSENRHGHYLLVFPPP
jgi:DNA gyrase inhibitor GyrI